MKNYYITYKGDYFGGNAVVRAESKEEAVELLKVDGDTWNFFDVKVVELNKSGVLYNDCGDY